MRLTRDTEPKRTLETLIASVRPKPNALDVKCSACGSGPGERCHLRYPPWTYAPNMFHVVYLDTPHKDRLALAEHQAR